MRLRRKYIPYFIKRNAKYYKTSEIYKAIKENQDLEF